ncbi:SusC/RagA family TonB-linked outer membrane protein [Sphingobacterium sp. SYP-B4668]|uniref:SusC/RagA family TonB-linked outer membrane protein n=1 Tax=Sphingobacterium sp. SYP-B4668 TaxID=2996035 RepID=UPI0022DE3389|nr:SusC/RagA family TonB-linked outer membrane protein [Sphingobacterium sp. SYP-B4668]
MNNLLFRKGLAEDERKASLRQLLLTMKITVFLSLVFITCVHADGVAQKVSLSVKNAKLVDVFSSISKQTNHRFLYEENVVRNAERVNVTLENVSLKDALANVLDKENYTFKIIAGTVTVNTNRTDVIVRDYSLQVPITGVVKDANGRGLAGATVSVKGSSMSTSTNEQGQFTLNAPANSILIIRFVGFATKEIVAKGQTSINVSLNPIEQTLDAVEVIATGFQKIDKRKFTGSVSSVDKNLINRSGAIDVSRMLQGAAAGVSVQNVSGTFGSTPKIRIRGNSSISANQEPLYVVNGVPISSPSNVSVSQLYSGDPASVLGSAIAGLNANDIEDIQILKDGAATSLYGTRAANGVVSITTKTGALNSRNINVSTAYTIGLKPDVAKFNLMNSKEEISLYKEMFDKGYLSNANWPNSTGAYTETYKQLALRDISLDQAYEELNRSARANTDWFDVLFRNNVVQEHNLSFSGGGEKHTYYVSGNYAHDDGQAIGFNMDRVTTDFRTVFNISKRLKLDANLNWNYRNQFTPGSFNAGTTNSDVSRQFEINPFVYAMNTSRAMYPYKADGSYKYYTENLAPFNIIEELNENFNEITSQDVRLSLMPSFQILPTLKYELTLNIRKTNNSYNHTITERSNVSNAHRVDYNDVLRNDNSLLYQDPADPLGFRQTWLPTGGFLYSRSNKGSSYYIRNQFNFKKAWTNHSLDALAGMVVQSEHIQREYTKAFGYMYYGGKIVSPSRLGMIRSVNLDDRLYIESFERKNELGMFATFQYSLFDRYNVEAGGRLDGSNMFGRLTRSKFLPNYNFGLSWNVDRENFFKESNLSKVVDYLKVRGSYALRGNTLETSPLRNAQYVNLTRLDASNSDIGIRVTSPELYNLNWEKDYITNVGLEFGLFNKFTFVGEYYNRHNNDLISSINIAQEEGFTTKNINYASMENNGVDLTLGVRNVLNSQNVRWDMNFIYGYVKNKVTKGELESALLTEITRSNGYPLIGNPIEGLYAFNYANLNSEGRPLFYSNGNSENGMPTLTNGIITASKDRSLVSYMGSRQPLSTGSFSNTFQYKDFELRVFLTYALGHKVFMTPISSRTYDDNSSKSADLNYRWQTIGDEGYTNIPGLLSTIQRTYLATISNNDEMAYNRSDFRVADAGSLRINEIMFSYEIGRMLTRHIPAIRTARLMFSANNIHYWASKKLRGVDPELLLTGGTAMPNPRSYSIRLTASF